MKFGILEFGILSLELKVWDLDFGVWCLEFWSLEIQVLWFWCRDLKFRVWGLEFWSLGFQVCCFGYGIWSSVFRILKFGF